MILVKKMLCGETERFGARRAARKNAIKMNTNNKNTNSEETNGEETTGEEIAEPPTLLSNLFLTQRYREPSGKLTTRGILIILIR